MLNEPADMLHFRDRVEHQKTSWAETRELRRLSAGRDLESQSQVLELLRQWFEGAAVQACRVYGQDLRLTISDIAGQPAASFTLTAAGLATLNVGMTSVPRTDDEWRIILRVVTADGTPPTKLSPGRGPSAWSRTKVEAALLAFLEAVERVRSKPPAPANARGGVLPRWSASSRRSTSNA